MLDIFPLTVDPIGCCFSNSSYGLSLTSLCEIAILFFSLSMSVITHSILSLTLKYLLVKHSLSPNNLARV